MFKALAVMTCYNEVDIIRWTLQHLFDQGIEVHVIDNWSSDGSADIAQEFPLAGFERFPRQGPSAYYSWAPLLKRVEEVAEKSNANWCLHYDSDEIRRSPKPGESLLEGLARVNEHSAKYTAVNFKVFHFFPTDDEYKGDPENHFKYYSTEHDRVFRQVKAWKNIQRVNLASSGGHVATFPGLYVYPENFVLKHYPLRTSEQAARKVLQERLGRYDPAELSIGWHVQYKSLIGNKNWIRNTNDLTLWEGQPDTGKALNC